jgi:hypothetical protein
VTQGPLPAAAPGAVVGLRRGLQVAQRLVTEDEHVSAASAVAAVGAAARNVRFAAEADGAVSAGARLYVDSRAVVEHLASIVTGVGSRAGRTAGPGGRERIC